MPTYRFRDPFNPWPRRGVSIILALYALDADCLLTGTNAREGEVVARPAAQIGNSIFWQVIGAKYHNLTALQHCFETDPQAIWISGSLRLLSCCLCSASR